MSGRRSRNRQRHPVRRALGRSALAPRSVPDRPPGGGVPHRHRTASTAHRVDHAPAPAQRHRAPGSAPPPQPVPARPPHPSRPRLPRQTPPDPSPQPGHARTRQLHLWRPHPSAPALAPHPRATPPAPHPAHRHPRTSRPRTAAIPAIAAHSPQPNPFPPTHRERSPRPARAPGPAIPPRRRRLKPRPQEKSSPAPCRRKTHRAHRGSPSSWCPPVSLARPSAPSPPRHSVRPHQTDQYRRGPRATANRHPNPPPSHHHRRPPEHPNRANPAPQREAPPAHPDCPHQTNR